MTTNDLKSFNYLENGEVMFSIFDTNKTTKILESGVYSLDYIGHPEYRVTVKIDTNDELVRIHDFPDKEKIDNLFESFFDPKILEAFTNLGFYHKTGILLYGKEGTGKSTIFKHYYNNAIKTNKAIVFQIAVRHDYLSNCWDFIRSVRKIQDNPFIVVFEEIDRYILEKEALLKDIFDGCLSINNTIFMASTNYIEKIPEAIKNRPSRFKYCLNIEGIQNVDDVYSILLNILNNRFNGEEIKGFANELKGQTLDSIKQFCVDKIMDLKTYSKNNKKIGFTEKK